MRFGPWEVMAIVAVLVVVFGAKKMPDIGKSFGETLSNFKKAAKGEEVDS